jgi:hypothetical protein
MSDAAGFAQQAAPASSGVAAAAPSAAPAAAVAAAAPAPAVSASSHSRAASSTGGITSSTVSDMSAQLSAVLSAKASQKSAGGHHAHQPSLAIGYNYHGNPLAAAVGLQPDADSLTENMERLRVQSQSHAQCAACRDTQHSKQRALAAAQLSAPDGH